jgi:integrase/recombinase XerD
VVSTQNHVRPRRTLRLPKLVLRLIERDTPPAGQGRRRRLEADLLTRPEIDAVVDQCPRESWIGLRNRTLIIVLWRTGLRISEALELREKDVDLIERRLVVQRGKGGKRRVLGIDHGTRDALEEWLNRRVQVAPPDGAPLFCTRRGAPIDASYIRRLLPRLALAAGVHKRVHAHGLRHAFATELQAEGAPLSMIRDLLGHSSLATTDTYLRRLGAGEAVDLARARCWTRRDETPSDATEPT